MQATQTLQQRVESHSRRGHFVYESGHHGNLWIDLDALLAGGDCLELWARELADRVRHLAPQVVCGPMIGGAHLAQRIAAQLGAFFAYTDRDENDATMRYRLPPRISSAVAGQTILLVDDAINAGSAVIATMRELESHGGQLVGLGCLISLNEKAQSLADEHRLPFVSLLQLKQSLWRPDECPDCRSRK